MYLLPQVTSVTEQIFMKR